MTVITDWGVIWGSKVVEIQFADDFMGAVDLRDEAPGAKDRFTLSADGTALILPDGRALSAENLRDRCLDPRPLSGRPLMKAGEFSSWADDGSDVRWELQGGIPVPPPGSRMGKANVRMELVFDLMQQLDPRDGPDRVRQWRILMGTWTCPGPDALDCRTPDLVVFPWRLSTKDSLWVDDPVIIGEVEEPGKAWLTERRLAFARKLPTVRELVVVDWRCRWGRVERRVATGWRIEAVPANGVLSLATVDWSMRLDDLLARADR
jgi:hypothetical protein